MGAGDGSLAVGLTLARPGSIPGGSILSASNKLPAPRERRHPGGIPGVEGAESPRQPRLYDNG